MLLDEDEDARPAAAAGSSALVALDDDDDDQEQDDEARAEAKDRAEFKNQMEKTGVRSAVRGVVALTATPAACGHDLREGASKVKHHICVMEHPCARHAANETRTCTPRAHTLTVVRAALSRRVRANYVGYSFTAMPYAERVITHEPVPDRKQITAIKKTVLYQKVLKEYGWWDMAENKPMPPFQVRADKAIWVPKALLSDIVEEGEKSSRQLKAIVDAAQAESARRGDKVLESDGVGIALMLESMSEKSAEVEPERRALIVSNYTRTNDQKLKLAHHILEGDLKLENGTPLSEACVCDIFVIIFDHKYLRIMWRGAHRPLNAPDDDPDFIVPPDHDSLAVLNAISEASKQLYQGAADARKAAGAEVRIDDMGTNGMVKCFSTKFININHVYTVLHLYARNQRMHGRPFKLKTVALAGDLGGRGVNFKPHGYGRDAARDTWIVEPHKGYLTDMFFMFDAVKNRRARHGRTRMTTQHATALTLPCPVSAPLSLHQRSPLMASTCFRPSAGFVRSPWTSSW